MRHIDRVCRLLPAVAAGVLAAAAAFAQADAVIHWKLDESTGTTALDSAATGGVQSGTSQAAAPQWQPAGGIIGGAILMSATAQADVDENISFTAGTTSANNIVSNYPLTFSSWVKTTNSITTRETFVFLGDQTTTAEYLQTSKDPNNTGTPNRGSAAARNTTFQGAAGGPALNDGAWHHVVGVYTSATSRTVYVDGILGGTNTTNVTYPDTTRFAIGALMRSTPTDSFVGMLDDVGLWNEALTPQRIALLNGLGRFSGVALDDASIAQVQAVYEAQSGQAASGPLTWQYATGLPSTTIGTTGTLGGGEPYIVLDASGNGVSAVPEPGGVILVALAVGGLALRRRRITPVIG